MIIALYRGLSPLSWAIRKFTRSDYSHAALVDDYGRCWDMWYPQGMRILAHPYEGHTRGTRIDYYAVIGMDDEMSRRVASFLGDHLGAKYDIGGVLRFVSRRRVDNSERWFCSELVIEALQASGLKILNAEPHEISPGHIPWSTELYKLGEEISEEQWRNYAGRRLCTKWGGAK